MLLETYSNWEVGNVVDYVGKVRIVKWLARCDDADKCKCSPTLTLHEAGWNGEITVIGAIMVRGSGTI